MQIGAPGQAPCFEPAVSRAVEAVVLPEGRLAPIERAGCQVVSRAAGEEQTVAAFLGVIAQVCPDVVEQVRRDRHVAYTRVGLRRLHDCLTARLFIGVDLGSDFAAADLDDP